VKALDQVYGKAVEGVPGVPGLESAERLAQDYLDGTGSLEKMVDTLIRYQVAKASASGFLTGLGGIVALPVTLPTNLVSVMYIQLQTVTAIAYMGGHDVRNDRVKTVCYACLCGNAATDVLKGAGITVGVKMTEQAIRRLSFEAIKKVNQAVGFRLVTKFGQTGVVNLGKAVPLVGGVVGGAFDGTTTYVNGKVAKKLFIGVDDPQATRAPETERWDIPEDLSELWSPEEKTRRNLPESDGRI
jgi:hypothetical protein